MGRTKHGEEITGASRYDPLLEKAALFYHKTLQRENEAFETLRQHGLCDADLIQRFQIGSCDGSLLQVLPKDDTIRNTLLGLGLSTALAWVLGGGLRTLPPITARASAQ